MKDFNVTELLGSSIKSGLLFGIGILVIFLAQLLTARALGAEDYGIFAYVYALITIASGMATLGFDAAALRFVSHYYHNHETAMLHAFIKTGYRWVATGTVAVMVLLVISLGIVSKTNQAPLLFGILLLPFWALMRFDCAALRGFRREAESLFPERIARESMLLLVSILAIYLAWTEYTPTLALSALGVGTALSSMMAYVLHRNSRLNVGHVRVNGSNESELWLKVALGLWCVNSLELVFTRMDILVLGTMSTESDTGIFASALLLANLTLLPTLAFNIVCIPRISALYHANKMTELGQLSSFFARLNTAAAILIGFVLLIFSGNIIPLFGASFDTNSTSNALMWLVIVRLLMVPLGPVAPLLAMTNNHKWLLANYAIFSVLKLLLLVAGIHYYGLFGAVIASAITLLLMQYSAALLVRYRLGFFPGLFASSSITLKL